jgi:hypothetical protein
MSSLVLFRVLPINLMVSVSACTHGILSPQLTAAKDIAKPELEYSMRAALQLITNPLRCLPLG